MPRPGRCLRTPLKETILIEDMSTKQIAKSTMTENIKSIEAVTCFMADEGKSPASIVDALAHVVINIAVKDKARGAEIAAILSAAAEIILSRK